MKTDALNYPLPPQLAPLHGATVTDPVFGTSIYRVTNSLTAKDPTSGQTPPKCQTEYASVSPFNADNSQFLLLTGNVFSLFSAQGQFLQHIYPVSGKHELNPHAEPRWSDSPDVFYYLHWNELKSYNTRTKEARVIQLFSEYVPYNKDGVEGISGKGEGDLTGKKQYIALRGLKADGSQEVFVYDLLNHQKSPVLPLTTPLDHLYMTPDDNLLVGFNQKGTGNGKGLWLYDRQLKEVRQISAHSAHMDVMRDTDGAECIVAAGDIAGTLCNAATVVKVRLADGKFTCLMLKTTWDVAKHIYCPEKGSRALVSTYQRKVGTPSATAGKLIEWTPYAHEIVTVALDGSGVERWAHTRNEYTSYTASPRASGNRDLSQVVWNSNWANPQEPERLDVYKAQIQVPVQVPVPQPTPIPAPLTAQKTWKEIASGTEFKIRNENGLIKILKEE